MKAPSDPPPLYTSATLRPSSRNINLVFDLQICSENFLALDLSRVCDATAAGDLPSQTASPYGRQDFGLLTENITFCSSNQITEIQLDEDDSEDDDDDLQWANSRPLAHAPPRYGYGDCKLLYRASNAPGKENMVRFPHKAASSPISIARQQPAGPIRPHSGPFSGPLTPSVAKPNRGPSIIPVNLLHYKKSSFNASDPMSPEVTCLGRIRNKELHSKCSDTTDSDRLSIDSQTSQKGSCFDTKNQLCGKRGKGRRKKEKARGLSNARRKRFSSAGSKSFPSPASSEQGPTRRERAAVLARSLSGLIEDVRQAEKGRSHYIPSVPPPNSLLLMRGRRKGNEDMDTDASGSEEHAVEDNVDLCAQDEVSVPPPNSLLLMRGCRVRGNLSLSPELKMGRASTKNKHAQAYVSSVSSIERAGDDAYDAKKLKARVAKHLSLLDLLDVEERATDEGASTSDWNVHGINVITSDREGNPARLEDGVEVVNKLPQEGRTGKRHSRPTLCQRRSFGELRAIEVGLRTKLER